jgi:hypothetical protein
LLSAGIAIQPHVLRRMTAAGTARLLGELEYRDELAALAHRLYGLACI